MTWCLLAFGAAFAIAVATTPLVRMLAKRLGIIDRPDNYRKVHGREIPLLGGVAVFAAFFIPLGAACLLPDGLFPLPMRKAPIEFFAFLLGGGLALGLGVADDALSLRARWKVTFQVLAASVAFAGGFRIDALSNPFGDPFVLGVLAFPITVLWFLACMNAINLLDGLDGLAAGAALFACITLFMVANVFGQSSSMFLMACLSGAILGFLMYNFHPASIFLGDSGTMFLGFSIATIALIQTRKTEAALTLLVPLIALGVPMFDTALAVLRRWLRRLPVSAADRQHIHHVLISLGLSHRKAVLIIYGACVALGGTAYLIAVGRNELTLFLLGALGIAGFASARMFGGMRFHQIFGRFTEDIGRMGRSAGAKLAVERCVSRMERAETVESLWHECAEALAGVELDFARLRLTDTHETLTWPARSEEIGDPRDLAPDVWTAHLRLRHGGRDVGELDLVKIVEADTLLADVPELMQRFREALAQQIVRVAEIRRKTEEERADSRIPQTPSAALGTSPPPSTT